MSNVSGPAVDNEPALGDIPTKIRSLKKCFNCKQLLLITRQEKTMYRSLENVEGSRQQKDA